MELLNLQGKKVTKGTQTAIHTFVYQNKATLSNEMKMLYGDISGIIALQLTKKTANRLTMPEILERAHNIEKYVLAGGAASYQTVFVSI